MIDNIKFMDIVDDVSDGVSKVCEVVQESLGVVCEKLFNVGG